MAGEFARTHTELREATCFAGPQTVRGILMRFTHPRLRSNTRARARTWSGASQSPAHAYLGFVCTHLRLCSDARARAQILTSMDFSFSKGGKDFAVLHRHPSLPPLMTSTASSYRTPTKATRAIQIRRSQIGSVIILPPSRTESGEQRRHAAPESPYASHLPLSEPLTAP
jgi:hypothetical protein